MRPGRHVPAPLALGVVLAAVCAAVVGSVGGSIFLLLERSAASAQARAGCGICGIVTGVRQVRLAPPRPGAAAGAIDMQASALRGGSLEGALVLLASLGRLASGGVPAPDSVYEVTVRFPDGSERVLREAQPPHWRPGDAVKVIRGRVEPLT